MTINDIQKELTHPTIKENGEEIVKIMLEMWYNSWEVNYIGDWFEVYFANQYVSIENWGFKLDVHLLDDWNILPTVTFYGQYNPHVKTNERSIVAYMEDCLETLVALHPNKKQ